MRPKIFPALLAALLLLPALGHAQDDDNPKAAPHAQKATHHPPTPAKTDKVEKTAKAERPESVKRSSEGPRASEPRHLGARHANAPVAAHSEARSVRVQLTDGTLVFGTVFEEEAAALVIDCSLGRLAIPRDRISTIAYDLPARSSEKRAPVQELDDDPPPRRR